MYKSHYLCIVSRSPDGEKETRVLFNMFIFFAPAVLENKF